MESPVSTYVPFQKWLILIKCCQHSTYQRAVVRYIMVLMQMMLQEVHILTAAVSLTLL